MQSLALNLSQRAGKSEAGLDCHANRIGTGAHTQRAQHSGTVQLHSPLAEPKLIGDLLVEPPRRDAL